MTALVWCRIRNPQVIQSWWIFKWETNGWGVHHFKEHPFDNNWQYYMDLIYDFIHSHLPSQCEQNLRSWSRLKLRSPATAVLNYSWRVNDVDSSWIPQDLVLWLGCCTLTWLWLPDDSFHSKPSPIPKSNHHSRMICPISCWPPEMTLQHRIYRMPHAEPKAFLCHRPWGMGGRDYSHRWWGYFRPLAAWGIFVPESETQSFGPKLWISITFHDPNLREFESYRFI